MFKVYVLYSVNFDKIYIGYTSDIEQRLLSHNEFATKGYTLRFRPWELLYTESYEIKKDAMRREKALKSARGRKWIWKKLVEDYKNNVNS